MTGLLAIPASSVPGAITPPSIEYGQLSPMLVVFGAAGGEHRDDVLDPPAADVRDIGLHVRAGGAGPGRPPDALLEAAG